MQTLEFEDLGDRTKLTQTMRFATTEAASRASMRLLQRLAPDA